MEVVKVVCTGRGAHRRHIFNEFNVDGCEVTLRTFRRANRADHSGERDDDGVELLATALVPASNDCAGLYRFHAPDLNMCFPPETWQTYDIVFTAPRWGSDGSKLSNARITVRHNGVIVQNDVELPNKTGAGKPEEPTLLPTRLQDHGNPVRYRNIWVVDRGAAPPAAFPAVEKTEDGAEPGQAVAEPQQQEKPRRVRKDR